MFDDFRLWAPGVKVILASIVVLLAVYQVLLMLVGYGKLRLPFLSGGAASRAHRAIGDSAVLLAVVTAGLCLGLFGVYQNYQLRVAIHSVAGWTVLVLIATKVFVVRRGGARLGRFLPLIGSGLLVCFVVLFSTTALLYIV